MNALPAVAVLMSTYNGETFLREQVDSILSQVNVSVSLYVRDDGSTDSTLDILQRYEESESKVHIVPNNGNLGPACSFMELLYHVTAQSDAGFFAFSDQDDVWKPDKLERAVSSLEAFDGPALYCSNQTLFDGEVEQGLRYSDEPGLTAGEVLFGNQIAGCTMVLNRKLAEAASAKGSRPSSSVLGLRMHDTWILLVALLLGDVVYDRESCIDYRIHQGNCVGVKNDRVGPIKRVSMGLAALRRKDDLNYRSKYAAELLARFPNMDQQSKRQIGKLANYKQGISNRVKLLTDEQMRKSSGESVPAYAAKVLMGTY